MENIDELIKSFNAEEIEFLKELFPKLRNELITYLDSSPYFKKDNDDKNIYKSINFGKIRGEIVDGMLIHIGDENYYENSSLYYRSLINLEIATSIKITTIEKSWFGKIKNEKVKTSSTFQTHYFPLKEFINFSKNILDWGLNYAQFRKKETPILFFNINDNERNVIEEINTIIYEIIKTVKPEIQKRKKENKLKKESLLLELDTDGDGILDLIDGFTDFIKLLKIHQHKIIDINRDYIQGFVKISNYIKLKKDNLQNIFLNISKSNNDMEIDYSIQVLKDEIHSYNLLIINSLNMINS